MSIRDDDYIRLNYISDFIEDFVAPSRRPRLHYLLSKPKRRDEIIRHFDIDEHLDGRCLHAIAPCDQNAVSIYQIMKRMGATDTCFMLSYSSPFTSFVIDPPIDEVDLEPTLQEVVGSCGPTILYCRAAKVGYWEGHDCDRWILCKNRS